MHLCILHLFVCIDFVSSIQMVKFLELNAQPTTTRFIPRALPKECHRNLLASEYASLNSTSLVVKVAEFHIILCYIYQNKESNFRYTSTNPSAPFFSKATLSQHIYKEIPIDVIMGLL